MKLLDLSNTAAREALATGTPVFLPVNPVEYHGPHLALRTDGLICAGLIRDLHAALTARHPGWPLVAVADLEAGVGPVPGPGSRAVPYEVVRGLVETACRALADLGARRVILMTFHGAPLHNLALDAGLRLLERRGVRAVAPFHLVLRRLIDGEGALFEDVFRGVKDPTERAGMIRDMGHDFHAGFLETSLALHYAPKSVHPRYAELPPCPAVTPAAHFSAAARAARLLGQRALAAELDFAAYAFGWHGLRPFPGYTGRPHRASREVGAFLARRIVAEGAPVVLDVLEGRADPIPPPMAWVGPLTLRGRFGPPLVPAAAIATAALDRAPR